MAYKRTIVAFAMIAGGFGYHEEASAKTKSMSTLANQLGSLIASEEPCGLTYDQDAIAKFVEENVPAEEMGFPSMLSLMTGGNEVSIKELSPSGKTAHCTQIRRTAKKHGFIK